MTTTLEVRRIPATATAAGQVVSWACEQGQQVTTGTVLGTFLDEYGEIEITAPCAGIVGRPVAPGARVEAGKPLVYVEPLEAPVRASEPPRGPSPHDAPNAPQRPSEEPPAPQPAKDPGTIQKPLEGPPPARRTTKGTVTSTLIKLDQSISERMRKPPEVEELSIEEKPPLIRRPKSKAATGDKVKNRGYYVLPRQEKKIARVAARLSLDEHDPLSCNESLIIRALIDQFGDLPPSKQRAIVEAYKHKEEQQQVASGWPRPGRPKGKKGS